MVDLHVLTYKVDSHSYDGETQKEKRRARKPMNNGTNCATHCGIYALQIEGKAKMMTGGADIDTRHMGS